MFFSLNGILHRSTAPHVREAQLSEGLSIMVRFFEVEDSNLLRPAFSRGATRRLTVVRGRLLLIVRRLLRLSRKVRGVLLRFRGLGVTNNVRLATISTSIHNL